MEAKRHALILLLLIFLNYVFSQTVHPSEKCAAICEYTDWALDADCKNRGLTSIPVECCGVESFDLRHNQIRVLPVGVFQGFEKLCFLDIEMIELEEIQPGAFTGNVNLIHIYVQLNSLVVIRRHTFIGVPNLRQLFLNSNNIHTVESGAFDGIPSLETLFLSDNNISDISHDLFRNLTMLRYLYIENNRISAIHEGTFKGLTNLRHLSLAGNNLVHIPSGVFDDLKHLRVLKLSFNQITSISPLPQLPRLNHVDLYYNKLTSVTNLTHVCFPPKKSRKRRSNMTKQFTQVFLAENPLHCDCDMEPLRLWMQEHIDEIHSHHRANATCASPEDLYEVSLFNQKTTFCPLQTSTQTTTPLTRPTDRPDADPEPSLMPITITLVSISSFVLVLLIVWTLHYMLTRRQGGAYKRQRSTDSDSSDSSDTVDEKKIPSNPIDKGVVKC